MPKFEGIPGRVEFRVTAFYYPHEGVETIRDPYFGTSEADAVASIREYLDRCKNGPGGYKQPNYKGKEWDHTSFPPAKPEMTADKAPETEVIDEETGEVVVSAESDVKSSPAKGTIWMANFGTHQRERVPAEKFGEYSMKGWVKAGPKTKV